jgi:phosphoenolpyruvate-protein kinase (PTS system EI component)
VADYVKLEGVAASEGVAVGPALVHVPRKLKPERESISEDAIENELERFRDAVEAVVRELSGDGGAVAGVRQ